MSKVYANGRSILHKGHGKTHFALGPDACKTPSPGGPVPVPYPNFSQDGNLVKGAASVRIEGNPAATIKSRLSRSQGDEAGTAGGVMSQKNMAAFGWPVGSINIKAENSEVVRFRENTLTNGNGYNGISIAVGEPDVVFLGLTYFDDAECPREECELGRDLAQHRADARGAAALSQSLYNIISDSGISNNKLGGGRMVGIGICHCGNIFQAISGDVEENSTLDRILHEFVGLPCEELVPVDREFDALVAAQTHQEGEGRERVVHGARGGDWVCAAAKIMTNAARSGHRIKSISERWIGKKRANGIRDPKDVTFAYDVFVPDHSPPDAAWPRRRVSDWPRPRGPLSLPSEADEPSRVVRSGGQVPSCGTCQALLPALICVADCR